MVRAIGNKVGVFALSLLGASILIFLVCQALPGDPASALLGTSATPEAIAAKQVELGLDRPLADRYIAWMAGLVQGDLGRSYATGDSVSALIAPTIPVTASLAVFSLLLAVLIAIPVGMVAALKHRKPVGVAVSAVTHVGMAIPAFWAGVLLSILFGVQLKWLPPNMYVRFSDNPVEWARHLVLPVVSLALIQSAVLVRYVRSSFLEVLSEDYFRTARAVGWRKERALFRHGLRNASLNLVTVFGLQLASILVGAIVVEQIFVLPGLGSLLLRYVQAKDVMVIQGIVMLLVVAVLFINALVELSYVFLDPRLRGRERA